MTETLREVKSLSGFKAQSKLEFLKGYKAFECPAKDCFVCKVERESNQDRNAETELSETASVDSL